MCIILPRSDLLKEPTVPRPKKNKMVSSPPLYSGFKPVGIRRDMLQDITLEIDEYEAIRLSDYEGLDHTDAAAEMEISRSTFSRLIEKARSKVASFLIEGRMLQIEGGKIHFRDNVLKCQSCGHIFNIDIGNRLSKCPECGSDRLLNLAGSFGHGRCCSGEGKKVGNGE
jgi:predicted DNA-binding protein (UPF0251 family)